MVSGGDGLWGKSHIQCLCIGYGPIPLTLKLRLVKLLRTLSSPNKWIDSLPPGMELKSGNTKLGATRGAPKVSAESFREWMGLQGKNASQSCHLCDACVSGPGKLQLNAFPVSVFPHSPQTSVRPP